jgi:cob(I)alamin adenosyltransferase
MKKGYLQVYTGDGKGKTTASLGLVIRAAGAGMNVIFSQFVKSMDTSELNIINSIENIKVLRYASSKKFAWDMNEGEKARLKEEMQAQLKDTIRLSVEEKSDVVVFDELLGALHGGYISSQDIMDLIENRPENCEYIITGRAAPKWLVDKADLVSSVEPVKHYMDAGVNARKGIEF